PRTRRRGTGGRFDRGGGRSEGRFRLHPENPKLESRMHANGAPRDAVLNPWHSQEELGGRFLGHRVNLKAKAGGDKSMPEKRGSLEDAKGAAPQGPRDRAKAGLPEPQSPAVEMHTRRYGVSSAALPGAGRSRFAARHLRLARRWPARSLKGMSGAPTS